MRQRVCGWLLAACVVGGSSAWAQTSLSIQGPGSRSYPIAVSPLKDLSAHGAGAKLATEFADIVVRDLELSGLFRIIDRKAYIEPPETAGITAEQTNFDNWSVIGALALVKGSVQMVGDQMTVEARLFDVYQRRQLVGRRYTNGSPSLMRRVANRFADEILQQFTGERGPFDAKIAFVSTRGGRFKNLYVMSVDGGDLLQVTSGKTLDLSPSWNPDSRSLLYTSYKRGNPDLYSLDLSAGREVRLSAERGLNLGGKWSPDGTRIAVALEDNGNSDIFILDKDGRLIRRVTDHWAIDVSPSWSPDGTQLAFCSSRTGNPQIYTVNADGSNVKRVTYNGSYNTSPAWSPKGDRIAYVSRNGRFNIFTIKPDGSDVKQLTNGEGNNEDPSWGPDGRYLVFTSTRSGAALLYVMDRSGASQVPLTRGAGDDTSPAWSRWLE
ncbi:MAG: Tol-Pal system beta propeller repeat protein TolB [Deltaproteobacteria bacterium]|nr:Tol-Pal system beta propeller repeat protein TolB [Deltaproteobacteria bacterium]MBI3388614.1 Tol-Pal system beta propeller repeat protein TolB [Deltaproteobacteria bacterium]